MSSPSKIASPSSEEMRYHLLPSITASPVPSSTASELLMSGRRHLNNGNSQLAASLLSQACGLYSKVTVVLVSLLSSLLSAGSVTVMTFSSCTVRLTPCVAGPT